MSGSPGQRTSPSSAHKPEVTDLAKALKRRLSEKMIRATTSSYRAFRATVKEGQSAELSNVPRVFATKQTTILKTQQVLNSMPKLMSEIEELYNTLETHIK